MINRRVRARAELYLFLITFVWGSTFVITKELLLSVPPFTYIAVRFLAASVLFGIVAFRSLREWDTRTLLHGTILGVLLFGGFAFQTVGLESTTASKSAFITGLMVVFTPFWQVIIERRAPKPGSVIGVVLVTTGLYFLTSPSGGGLATGDVLTIACAALFGLYIVYIDVFTKGDAIEKLTFAQFVVAGILGTLLTLFLEPAVFVPSTSTLLQLAYLVVFATIIALYVQTRFQRDSTPTRSVIIFSLEPVIAAGFAYVVADEVLGLSGWFGGALILAGLLVSELSDRIFPGKGMDAHDGLDSGDRS